MTIALEKTVQDALKAGAPKTALEAVGGAPLSSALAVVVAEALEANGQQRRAGALLWLAALKEPGHRGVSVAAARAMLRLGLRRRAKRVLEAHADTAAVLCAVAAGADVPAAVDVVDDEDGIDFALASAVDLAALRAVLAQSPASSRVRLEVARRQADDGDIVGAKATLRAGLSGGRQDARLELALAMVCFAAGDFEEAAVVVAKARSRYPSCARSQALLVLLASAQLSAGRRDDAVSVVHGATSPGPVLKALASLRSPAPVQALGTTGTTGTTGAAAEVPAPAHQAPPPTPAAAAAPPGLKTASAPRPEGAWKGVVEVKEHAAAGGSPLKWLAAFSAVVVAVVIVKGVGGDDVAGADAGTVVAVSEGRDAGIGDVDVGPTSFSAMASRCGVTLAPWTEAPLPLPEFSGRAKRSGWNGRDTKVGSLRIDVAPAVAPGLAYVVLRTGARADPAAVIREEDPGVVAGVAMVNVVSSGRARVSDVVDVKRTGIAALTTRSCPEANPGSVCVVGRSQCEGLDVTLQAICAQGEAGLEGLATCEHDTVILMPNAGAADASSDGAVDSSADGGVDDATVDAGSADAGSADAGG
jgi:hypothetical protein